MTRPTLVHYTAKREDLLDMRQSTCSTWSESGAGEDPGEPDNIR